MNQKNNRFLFIAVAATILAIFAARTDFGFLDFNPQDAQKKAGIAKLNQVLNVVNKYYVDSLNWQDVSTGAIEGLLKTLDPHSVYFDPVAVEQNEEQFSGHYYGIGIQFDVLDGYITVISVISGSPSEAAGLLGGDKITRINGTSAHNISVAEVPKKLKGPQGSEVQVTIKREGLKPFEVTLIRDEIPIFTINTYFKADTHTGYIWPGRFASTTADEFEEALQDLEKQGIDRLIIDLRGNGGGYLRQAVKLAGMFIAGHKKVVYTKGRLSRFDETFYTDDFGRSPERDYPLIVLIDHSSASASEIVSGAFQDYDRALIVGERSFGKGLVQNEFELDDNSRIRITVSKYYTPSGRLIQRPYKGKNIEEYYLEGVSDSIKTDTSEVKPLFFTSAGRKVYGGGGITPDVEVAFETYSKARAMTARFNAKRIFFETAAAFVNGHPGWKMSFKKFKTSFHVSRSLLNTLRQTAKKKGVKFKAIDFHKDELYIKNRLKAEIARNIWGAARFYEILLEYDNQFQKALDLFPEIDAFLHVQR